MHKLLIAMLFMLTTVQVQSAQDGHDVLDHLQNTGFESPDLTAGDGKAVDPDHWFYFSSVEGPRSGVAIEKKRHGSQSLRFKASMETNSYRGYAQWFRAKPGIRYSFSVYVINGSTDPMPASAYGQISLEFQTAEGTEVQRVHGPVWSSTLPMNKWETFIVEGTAPEQAATGTAVITLFSKDSTGFGTFFVDDIEFTQTPSL
ncbi:MAG TPA: hypothetical protein DCZ95_13195 [Verrucomicrobia bacterium]|nr:MAG: hypothetical protein A2X46_11480 [Lentisphaerae bacterium GWF2_57_35]HBA85042.1 hypothetical protein [Verrucomicrobiota bacterium]